MIYAVIDTNVFVSAFMTHNPNSATTKVVAELVKGAIKPLYNAEIIAVYKEVLSRAHFHISPSRIDTLVAFFYKNGIASDRAEYSGLFTDESDRVFYEICLSKEESFLVTGNLKHYPKEPRVVTPAEMLEILEKE